MLPALLAILVTAGTAHAQDAPTSLGGTSSNLVDDATVLAIAQICVSEANWTQGNDCAAIVEVLRSRQAARGDATLLETARAYCPRATGAAPPRSIRYRWIQTLRLDGEEPSGWRVLNRVRVRRGEYPLPWSRFRPLWMARIAEAEDLIAHPRYVCGAEHWGAKSLERRHLGWTIAPCGSTVDRYWRLPSR